MDIKKINRRRFLGSTIATTATASLARKRLVQGSSSEPAYQLSGRPLRIGYVGCGTQGLRQLLQALPREDIEISAVCDPNLESYDYIPWFRHELRDKVRAFLDEPAWDENAEGCHCGLKVAKEIVEKYYLGQGRKKEAESCKGYADFRQMLAEMDDLDAVYVMAPDHLHASVAIAALDRRKHVITHKPLSNIFFETEMAVEAARRSDRATHMFCAADLHTTALLKKWVASGVIGRVKEIHNWSNRPYWPQGMTEYPREAKPVPEGLKWDLWLGPVPDRPYHPDITHAVFRGWYDFGSGALGDMGHYSFFQIFDIFELGSPVAVEASRSQYWAIIDHLWKKQENRVSYPRASKIKWDFAGSQGQPISLYWYDGGLRPSRPDALKGQNFPEEGLLMVGDRGTILGGFRGENPVLITAARGESAHPPEYATQPPLSELEQWLRAASGGQASRADFERIYPLCETICLGNVALRINQRLEWNAEQRQFTNSNEANGLLKRQYRPGWELG